MTAPPARRCFIAATVAVLSFALGGCSLAVEFYLDQVAEAAQQIKGTSVQQAPTVHPLADRVVAIAGPIAITLGPQTALPPADRRYLLDGLSAGLRRRFRQVVVMESSEAAAAAGPSTVVVELDTIRDSSNAQPAVVHAAVRVYANGRFLQSVIRSPAVAIDFRRPDRTTSIDELLVGLNTRLDTLLQPQ
jgi:hypothetical protein